MAKTPIPFGSQKLYSVLVAFSLGCCLLYYSVPRVVASLEAYPGNEILRRMQRGEAVDSSMVERLITSRQRSLDWWGRGRDWTDLALAQLALASFHRGVKVGSKELIRNASLALKEGLARSPLNPHAWTRLAYTWELLREPPEKIVSALLMSLYTGPYEPELTNLRLKLCLSNWENFSEEGRYLVRKQILFAWKISKSDLVALADGSKQLGEIRSSLGQNPGLLQRFERRLQRRRSGKTGNKR